MKPYSFWGYSFVDNGNVCIFAQKKLIYTMKKLLIYLLGFTLTVIVAGCRDDEDSPVVEPADTVDSTLMLPALHEIVDLTVPHSSFGYNTQNVFARVKFNIMVDSDLPGGDRFFDDSRIFLCSVTTEGFQMRGSFNGIVSGRPAWQDADGKSELKFSETVFCDGRKDWAEGSVNGEEPNETSLGLNSLLTQNYAPIDNNKWSAEKNPGVTTEGQVLFAYSSTCNVGDGYFYVIPRNQQKGVGMTIVYHVETIDSQVDGLLSDGVTHGFNVEGKVILSDILGAGIDFEPGKAYQITIIMGSENPRIEYTTGVGSVGSRVY
ncbi:MAG: hypothetical protein J5805_07075 [Bacteroidaceae bacterium]|nr:hypothetical protein [Bacteroidaceae bacterium]